MNVLLKIRKPPYGSQPPSKVWPVRIQNFISLPTNRVFSKLQIIPCLLGLTISSPQPTLLSYSVTSLATRNTKLNPNPHIRGTHPLQVSVNKNIKIFC